MSLSRNKRAARQQRRRVSASWLVWSLGAWSLGAIGCSSSIDAATGLANEGVLVDGSGSSSAGTSGGGASATAAPETNPIVDLEATGGGANVNDDTACTALRLDPDPVETQVPREVTTTTTMEVPAPVAIYIVLDNSGSMDDPAGGAAGAQSKWEVAVGAITDFVNDPGSVGIDVAIQYFHPIGVGANADECDGTGHSTSAVVIGRLPAVAADITTSLASTNPGGDTPTVGALTGGTQYCQAFQAANVDEKCVVVLVTDGQPNGCGLDSTCPGGGGGGADCVDPTAQGVLTPIAATGASNGVTTFTVGMAGITAEGFALLDAIAVAGGSDCTPAIVGAETCDVSTSGSTGFLDALNTIRDTVTVTETITETITETVLVPMVLPCEFAVPPPPAGEELDPSLVVVALTIDSAPEQQLAQADSEASCSGDGWFYQDPADLTLIAACPATCDRITAATDSEVNVLLGCAPAIQ